MPGFTDALIKLKKEENPNVAIGGGLYRLGSTDPNTFIPTAAPNQAPPMQRQAPTTPQSEGQNNDMMKNIMAIAQVAGAAKGGGAMTPQGPTTQPQPGVFQMGTGGAAPTQTPEQPGGMQKSPMMDFWGQKTMGNMPLDQFVQVAGMLSNAISPNTPQGRMGAGLSRMGGSAYNERMQREYDAPDKELDRRLRRAQISTAEREPDNRSAKEKTFESYSSYNPEQKKMFDHLNGLDDTEKETKSNKQKEFEFFQSLDADQRKLYLDQHGVKTKLSREVSDDGTVHFFDESGKEVSKSEAGVGKSKTAGKGDITPEQERNKVAYKEETDYLYQRLDDLDIAASGGEFNEEVDPEKAQTIAGERNSVMDRLVELRQYGYGEIPDAPKQRAETSTEISKKINASGILKNATGNDIAEFVKVNPDSTAQDIINFFKKNTGIARRPIRNQVDPTVKNKPISGMQRQ